MGNELDKPILDKNSYDEESKYIKFGLSSLQGWKTQMEDYNFYSIDIIPNSDKNIDIFGIMDGHRGPEVAKYISTHFIETLLSNNSFKEDNYLESLQETFLQVDKNLKTDQAQKELIKISEELKLNEEKETISIKQLYKPEDNLNEKEIEQIKYIKDILNPNNLINCNIPSYSGCSGIVILVTNNIIYIANAGDCRCIPLNENYEVITDKSNKLHLINNDNEKKRIQDSLNFKEKKFYPEFLETTRGLGNLEYKQNKWLKPEDQAFSPQPEVIEINYEECKYLIIGSHGVFDENKDMDLYDKYNKDVACYFMDQIKKDENKKFSNIIEEYLDSIVPKDKKDINLNRSYMDNMTCFLVELFKRPKYAIEEKKEERRKRKVKIMQDQIEKPIKLKKDNPRNKSMKNLLSFFTNINLKNDRKESKEKEVKKKLDTSASFSGFFKINLK